MSLIQRFILVSTVALAAVATLSAAAVQGLGQVPLYFEQNIGQTAAEAKFLARAGGMTAFLTERGVVFPLGQGAAVRMEFADAQAATLTGLEPATGLSSYFRGNDPSRWTPNAPHFTKVRYQDIYDGVDAVFHGQGRRLEYDLVLQPGADPAVVRLRFTGADRVEINGAGDLLVQAGEHRLAHRLPFLYQEGGGERRRIEGRYVIGDDGDVTFAVGAYDPDAPLVIDPVIDLLTYAGGTGNEEDPSIVVDAAGNIYVAAVAASTDFPVTSGAYDESHNGPETGANPFDVVVFKLDPTGSNLLLATYVGGSKTELTRCAGKTIAVDAAGRMFVTGATSSDNFPTTENAFKRTYAGGKDTGDGDAFLFVLSPDGKRLLYSTYLGGGAQEQEACVALGASGNPIVVGQTESKDFPITEEIDPLENGGLMLFVAEIAPAGQGAADLRFSTILSGSDQETGSSFVTLPGNRIAVVANTRSRNFPTTPGAFDTSYNGGGDLVMFILDLSSGGAQRLVYSTYFGGSQADSRNGRAIGIGADAQGDIYITGETVSLETLPLPLPVTPGAYQTAHGNSNPDFWGGRDAFVARIHPAGQGAQDLVYSTYFGGAADERNTGIAVTPEGYAFVLSRVDGVRHPTLDPVQPAFGGKTDFGLAALDPTGSALLFSTFLGGADEETDGDLFLAWRTTGGAPKAVLYVAGETLSEGLPATAGAFQATQPGLWDLFITAISGFSFLDETPPAVATVNAASFTAPVAADSIATAYVEGADFPVTTAPGGLAAEVAGVTVKITDSTGAHWDAPLFFIGGAQINLHVPAGVSEGAATVSVYQNGARIGRGSVSIARIAPGIFMVGQQEVAAAWALVVAPDGSRENILTFNGDLSAKPLDLGPAGAGVYLQLFGTGIRRTTGDVSATAGGQPVGVLGAVPQGEFEGFDQVNIGPLPRSLAGAGLIDVVITVDGIAAKPVRVHVQ